ncbi:YvrJ family protein [Shouchella patagoniensis]|uniref:YvrJ family protein n=1 Tax=Shouchella patagoniensis TaxID=228576 RepID=UPI0009950C1E|nr:YvrJ family protein [Shouchella patagoniensis]
MTDWVTLISNVGFPIAVASYLLVRLEPVVKDLQQSIAGLTTVISRQEKDSGERE